MAITIEQAPTANLLAFAGDYLIVQATSGNTSESGFRYRVRVFFDSSGTASFTTFVRPNTSNKLVVDISDVVLANMEPIPEDTHGNNIFDDANFQIVTPSQAMHVKVEVQEYYSGAVQGSAVDRTFFVIKGYGAQSEGLAPARTGMHPKVSAAGVPSVRIQHHDALGEEAIVDVPNGHPYLLGIPFQNFGEAQIVTTLRITKPDGTNLDKTSSDLDNMPDASATFTNGTFYYLLDIGPAYWGASHYNLSGITSATFVLRSSTSNMSHPLKVNELDANARKNPWVSFTFLNDLGGYDFLLMDGRLQVDAKTDHETMSQDFVNFSTTATVNKYAHNKRSFSRRTTTTYTIRKTHLEDVEVKLARALSRAELVYMKIDGEAVKPVTIETVDFDFNTHKIATLRPLTVRVVDAREERC